MKTLILNGSPRKEGNTVHLIHACLKNLRGEFKLVNAYDCNISPCIDCRYCWTNSGCSIEDEMQEIYEYIKVCDNIIIASPIYFSELTGKLLDVASRLQTYYCGRAFRKQEMISKMKKGAVILVGGGDGNVEKAYGTAITLLHYMNANNIFPVVYSHNTNQQPAIQNEKAMKKIGQMVEFLNW